MRRRRRESQKKSWRLVILMSRERKGNVDRLIYDEVFMHNRYLCGMWVVSLEVD